MPKIAIVAGEASGDLLGQHLIRALKVKRDDLSFIGIAGPKMIGEGAQSLFPLEKLSVRGYVEVLRHIVGLLKLRKSLFTQLLTEKPAVFIGIDAPDFNFWLERKFKNKGIPAIHYVSPSIWAWRGGRMKKIKRAVSHVLALFPFEPALYQAANIRVTYVGHPLADELPLEPDQRAARETLKIKQDKLVIAMLPGSRQSEVRQHAALFVKTARLLTQKHGASSISGSQLSGSAFSGIQFLVPLITRETRDIFEQAIHQSYIEYPDMDIDLQLLFGHAHDAMEAADVVIVASGTATLEAALLKRPMVITYRMPALSWWILNRMRYQPFVGLPNILAGKFLVPELLQDEATPQNLSDATQRLLNDSNYLAEIKQEFTKIHLSLKQNAAEKAATVILSYL
ncbi:MAG: lipid-A-disaccharide synthase [Pseudomonadota bacterium]